jgi:hypothetical protein
MSDKTITHVFVRQNGLNQISNLAILVMENTIPDTLGALEKALSEWVSETPEGKAEFESTCGDFNIGDLILCYESPSLKPFLEKHGARIVSIETAGCETIVNFDRHLVDTSGTPVDG